MKLPQFSLRDLFWLVLVAACLSGWWVDRSALRRDFVSLDEKRQASEEMAALRRDIEVAKAHLALERVARRNTAGGLRISEPGGGLVAEDRQP